MAACRHLDDHHVVLTLEAPHVAAAARPGQFIMLPAREGTDPLLRRPLGIMDINPPFLSVFFQIAGRGTRFLSRLLPGDALPVLGPLGSPFPVAAKRRILAIAGGRGIAPLLFALKEYSRDNDVFLLYGARCAALLHLRDRIAALPLGAVEYCTETGDFGRTGKLSAALPTMLADHAIDMTIACGPQAMFADLDPLLAARKTEDYFSAEAHMACGFGACNSCVVPAVGGGYRRVCRDGPVFPREAIQWRT